MYGQFSKLSNSLRMPWNLCIIIIPHINQKEYDAMDNWILWEKPIKIITSHSNCTWTDLTNIAKLCQVIFNLVEAISGDICVVCWLGSVSRCFEQNISPKNIATKNDHIFDKNMATTLLQSNIFEKFQKVPLQIKLIFHWIKYHNVPPNFFFLHF